MVLFTICIYVQTCTQNGSLLNILSEDLLSTGFAPIKYKLIYMLVQGNVGKKSLSYKN